MTKIRRLMVIGAGQMGRGIAQVAAQSGIEVILNDVCSDTLDNSLASIHRDLTHQGEKNRISTNSTKLVLKRIIPTLSLEECARVDFVIEAATERLATKKKIFTALWNNTRETTILATNTSSLSITDIASATGCPHRVIGMHFMNPVTLMRLVEVIKGINTSNAVCTSAMKLARFLDKEPIVVNDYPGFIANRLLMPMINEAIFAVQEGVADIESVDQIMKLGMNHPMGPLALADLIGLDTCLAIMETLHAGFGDDKYRPCPLLRNMVKAGHLGKKSKNGFYDYCDKIRG